MLVMATPKNKNTRSALLHLNKVRKSYGESNSSSNILKNVSLSVYSGEFIAIMGPSGAGKTTLLNILGLLDTPSSGSYKIAGHEIAGEPEKVLATIRRDTMGFVFQNSNLLPKFSLLANVQMPLAYRRFRSKDSKTEALRLLHQVGLTDKQSSKPSELSAGQLQRGAIARALIQKPSVILADEPTGNLDSKTSTEIMKLFKKLHTTGSTIIIVTHDEVIARYADRIVHVHDGMVTEATS
jgi:putative ABC transport system ATP-binding protein